MYTFNDLVMDLDFDRKVYVCSEAFCAVKPVACRTSPYLVSEAVSTQRKAPQLSSQDARTIGILLNLDFLESTKALKACKLTANRQIPSTKLAGQVKPQSHSK